MLSITDWIWFFCIQQEIDALSLSLLSAYRISCCIYYILTLLVEPCPFKKSPQFFQTCASSIFWLYIYSSSGRWWIWKQTINELLYINVFLFSFGQHFFINMIKEVVYNVLIQWREEKYIHLHVNLCISK